MYSIQNTIKIGKEILGVVTFLFISGQCIAQNIDRGEILSKLNIRQCTISAFEYKNGQVVKEAEHFETFDSRGRKTSFCSRAKNDKKRCSYSTYSENGETEHKISISEHGDTLYYFSCTRTKNYLHNVQLDENKDTLHSQFWYYNSAGLVDRLVNRYEKGYFIKYKYEYNEEGRETKKISYNKEGEKDFTEYFYYKSEDNCFKKYNKGGILQKHKCSYKNKKVSHFDKRIDGHLYGILLKIREGGTRVEYFTPDGLTERIEYRSKNQTLLSLIKFEYKKVLEKRA